MKIPIIAAALVASANSTQAIENIFNRLLNIKTHDYSKSNAGIDRANVGSSGVYFYKLNNSNSLQVDKTVEYPPIIKIHRSNQHVRSIIKDVPVDTIPIKPVIDKSLDTSEVGYTVEKIEKKSIYGDGSPMKDTSVLIAWEKYHEAKRRLDDNRRKMEELRQLRKMKEASKKSDIENKN